MKIDNKVIPLPGCTQSEGAGRARVVASAAPAVAAPAGSVSTRLQTASGGEFDAARVAQVREAIASGRYRVDARRIADGLLDSVRELLKDGR